MHLRIYNEHERGEIYERLTGCKVYYFDSDTVELLGAGFVEGRASKEDEVYHIGLRRGLSIAREFDVLAHEFGHVKAGHVFTVHTQAQQIQGDVSAAQILKGVRTSADRKAYDERERQADEFGETIKRRWIAEGIHP